MRETNGCWLKPRCKVASLCGISSMAVRCWNIPTCSWRSPSHGLPPLPGLKASSQFRPKAIPPSFAGSRCSTLPTASSARASGGWNLRIDSRSALFEQDDFADLIGEQTLGHAGVYGHRTLHDLGRRLHPRGAGCHCRVRRCPETGRGDAFGFCCCCFFLLVLLLVFFLV